MNVAESLIKARIQLILDKPFFGNLILQLPLKATNSIPTFMTDGKLIYYNEKFAEELSDKEKQFVICHEVLHPTFHHFTRRGERNVKRWNFATDYAINGILYKTFGFIPENVVYDEKYDGMGAEEIYNKLPDMSQQQDGKYGRFSNENITIEIDEKGNITVNGKPVRQIDEHHDIKGSEEEINEFEKEWTVNLSKALNSAKMAGKFPAEMEIFIDKLLQPKLDWNNMMKQFLISNAKSDYSWIPPSRRFLHSDLYMPSLSSESLGEVAVIIDNSGSTTDEQQRFLSECNSLLQQFDMNLHLITVDTQVNSYKVYNRGDKLEVNYKGGGGTNIRKAWDYMKEKRINPDVVVCFTDGYTSEWPEKEEQPTLFVLCKDSIDLKDVPFGLKARIE